MPKLSVPVDKLNVYDAALMLAGQFCLVHFHTKSVPAGALMVIPHGEKSGVYMNPTDAPPEAQGTLLKNIFAPKKKRRR